MIAYLSGTLRQKKPTQVVIETQGVGYAVQIPLSTFYQLGVEGSSVALQIHTHVREDTLALFGFLSDRERSLFEKLISVNGIGPRLGISVMSGASVDELVTFIRAGDVARLTRIPGVGRKTAERMVLELRDKIPELAAEEGAAAPAGSPLEEDVVSALINLGYQKNLAERTCSKALDELAAEERTFENLLRRTLKRLSGSG